MYIWRPRSVLQLVVVGFFAALAPLCIAILFTIETLGELSDKNRNVARLVVDITRLGEEVQRDLLELERRARQYLALGDPNLAELFERERQFLMEDLLKLQALQSRMLTESPDIAGLLTLLERLDMSGREVPGQVFESGDIEDNRARMEQSFELIMERRVAIDKWLEASVENLLDANSADADALLDYLMVQLSVLAAATLTLLLFFSYWINKPLKKLAREIQQLGTEGLGQPIEIVGPEELRELGTKLEWLRQRLHESEEEKQKFLRHISHELKTPLASLREGTDLLAEHVTGKLSQQQQEIVEIVRLNGIELQRLIENLVDINRLPQQQTQIEDIDLHELCNGLVSQYRISLDSKSLRLEVRGSTNQWRADPYKLRIALDNLLSNAVNYAPEGGVIKLVWKEKAASLVVDVANSGEAIPSEDTERIFEPFFQSVAKRSGPIKGSGIGLSVARECMESQGGTLELVADTDLPVCFRLTCPRN
ncbi:HAMP domain-containing protein [Pseudohalioglobus sediminis]|uniref:histidine kinase n=1 Tax=Pseudohalioglobus sediminis TaxID=2606449 RepID=A0A5B0WS93_9GAMM|nr:ATP-binding protein [Pseudohalioglobus sediminis]KAA1189940.1 HAMP domain-containing protein [Pseudohalioglobus sediminis]